MSDAQNEVQWRYPDLQAMQGTAGDMYISSQCAREDFEVGDTHVSQSSFEWLKLNMTRQLASNQKALQACQSLLLEAKQFVPGRTATKIEELLVSDRISVFSIPNP